MSPKAPPIPVGGPGVPPLVAAAGSGYGEGFAANSHRFAPTGMMAAVKYPRRGTRAPTSARRTTKATLHCTTRQRAAIVEMIKCTGVKGRGREGVNREGKTTADMANGSGAARIQPWPEALALPRIGSAPRTITK